MGNQIIVHRPNNETSKQKKATTDLSLRSIVAKEQTEIDSIKNDSISQIKVSVNSVDMAAKLLVIVNNLHYVADSLYSVIKNIYINNNKAEWLIKVEEEAYDYMREYSQYFITPEKNK